MATKFARTNIKAQKSRNLVPFAVYIGNRVSVTLYPDSRPNFLEVATLQKGLVLSLDGRELIEEGVGFGAPVAKYRDKTFFSSSAECSIKEKGNLRKLVKCFSMDTISRKRIWRYYINEEFYAFFHRLFDKVYVGHNSLAPGFNRLMELRRAINIQTEFIKVKPRGTITFEYTCYPNIIKIGVNLFDLERDECQEILILNEQGASFFREYHDTNGLRLLDEKIGAWQTVSAEEASFSYPQENLTFSLRKMNSSKLFRGREKTKGRFSWAGLGYSLDPCLSEFNYIIKLNRADRKLRK